MLDEAARQRFRFSNGSAQVTTGQADLQTEGARQEMSVKMLALDTEDKYVMSFSDTLVAVLGMSGFSHSLRGAFHDVFYHMPACPHGALATTHIDMFVLTIHDHRRPDDRQPKIHEDWEEVHTLSSE